MQEIITKILERLGLPTKNVEDSFSLDEKDKAIKAIKALEAMYDELVLKEEEFFSNKVIYCNVEGASFERILKNELYINIAYDFRMKRRRVINTINILKSELVAKLRGGE